MRECVYITFFEAPDYMERGYKIKPLPGNHGIYRCLATRDVPKWRDRWPVLLIILAALSLVMPAVWVGGW